MSQGLCMLGMTQGSYAPMVSPLGLTPRCQKTASTPGLIGFLATRDRTGYPIPNQLHYGNYRLDVQPGLQKSNGGYPIDGVDQGAIAFNCTFTIGDRYLSGIGHVYLD